MSCLVTFRTIKRSFGVIMNPLLRGEKTAIAATSLCHRILEQSLCSARRNDENS